MRQNTIKFRQYIVEVETSHIELKKRANCKGAQDSNAQYEYPGSAYTMFILYTAYYIVKHGLYLNNTVDEYINKVINQSTRRFNDELYCNWAKNNFKESVINNVLKYENVENDEQTK